MCVRTEEMRRRSNTNKGESDKFDSCAAKTHQTRKSLSQTFQACLSAFAFICVLIRSPAFLIDPLPINIQTYTRTYP